MQGRTEEVHPQRLSLKWEYAQAGGSVLPLTGNAEGEEIVLYPLETTGGC